MARHRYALVAVAVGVAALLALAMLFGTGAGADTAQRLELDSTHPLATEEATEVYQEEGHVTRNLTRLNAQLTYTNSLDEVDASCGEVPKASSVKEPGTEWIVLTYCEDVDRTLRFNLPRDYFTPINGDHQTRGGQQVTYAPVDGRNRTAVEVTVREPTVVVMPVSKVDTTVFGTMADWSDRIGSATNTSFSLPFVSGGDQWNHVSGERLGARGTVPIEGHPDDVLVQYKHTDASGEETWLNAPDEPREEAPVYTQTRVNESSRVWVVTRAQDPPDVRYKPEGDTSGWLGGVGDDLGQLPGRIAEDLPF